MVDKLSNELLDAANGKGAAIRRKKMYTAWQKPIRLSRITGGRNSYSLLATS